MTNNKNNITALSLYFNDVDGSRLLTRDEEVDLAKRIENGDKTARNKLIQSNLRLVISVAKNFQGQGCDLEDLIQEGNIGLMKGIDRFDWRRGLKLSTYAVWWTKQRVDRHISNHGRTVRVPVHVRAMTAKYRKMLESYQEEFNCNPTIEEMMEMLQCTKAMAEAVMQTVNNNPIVAIDHSPSSQIDNEESLHNYIEDEDAIDPIELVSHQDLVKLIRKVINTLPPRDEKILRLRFGIGEDALCLSNNFKLTDKEAKAIKQQIRQN